MNIPNSKLRDLARRASHLYKYATQGIFKGKVGNDESTSRLELYRQNDATKNSETSPPEDERIDLPCIWAVEFYTPSQVDKLVDNLKRLGWDQSDYPRRENPVSWLLTSRQRSEGGSWQNLGMIRTADDTRAWPRRDRTAQMPMNVYYATGSLHTLTPSLTCIVIQFMFEDSFRSRFDEAIRRYRQTVTQPLPHGHQILDPGWQKNEEIRQFRSECAELAARWFQENLPGVFSSGLLGYQLPTYELVTLHKAEPFPDRNGEEFPPPAYLQILGLEFSPSVWKEKQAPSLKFSWGLGSRDPEYHSVFAVKDTDIEEKKQLEAYGGLSGLPDYIDSAYNKMIVKLALIPLLEGYSRRLNKLRDSVTERIRRPSRRSPIHTLEELLGNVAYDVDIAAVTTDLISTTREPSWLDRSLKTFERCNNWAPQIPLSEVFRSAINRHATGLKQTDKSLRDHLTQFGSLIAATEDVRTQKRILWLTLFVAVLALATFFGTDADSELLGWFQYIWSRLSL